MTERPGAAARYAAGVPAGEFSWRRLERTALAAHPVAAAAHDDAAEARAALLAAGAGGTGHVARGILGFVAVISPLIVPGVLVVGAREPSDAAPALIVAMALALASIAVRVGEWVRAARGGPGQSGREAAMAAFSALFGLLSIALAVLLAQLGGVALAWWAAAVFVAMTTASVISLVVIVRRSRRGVAAPAPPDAQLARALASLDADERAAVAADVAAALDVLEHRGLVSADDRRLAASVPLGTLARWRFSVDRRALRRAAGDGGPAAA